MSTLLKKFILSFLSFSILFFSVAPNYLIAKAQTEPTWYNQDFKTWSGKVNDASNPSEIFGERYTSAQVQWVIYGLFNFILQSSTGAEVLSCLFTNSASLDSCASAIQSLTASSTNSQNQNLANISDKSLLSLMFADRSFSGIGYVKEKIQNFSLVPIAHAQSVGFGYDVLQPIQSMWSASRNIAFGLFVLAAVIFAFMIMFRVKISPQVVITVQSAIPKLIISLILVTFSYAIAGFLIDLMYVVIGLLSVIMSSFMPSVLGLVLSPNVIFSMLTQGNVLGVIGINIQSGIFVLIFAYLAPLIITLAILSIVVGVATGGLLLLIPLILMIIVVIVGVWMSLKTIWALLKAFVNIILLTIFAPLQIVAGVIVPNFGFGQWLKSYISNLSVFIVTGALYLFSIIFLTQGVYIGLKDIAGGLIVSLLSPIFGSAIGGSLIASGLASNYTTFPPLLGSGSAQGVGLLFLGVSFVLFTMIPKATELIQSLLSGKPFAYGSALGEIQQGVNWASTGTGVLAHKRSMDTSLSPDQRRQARNIERVAEFLESFTKGRH
jgi:hypothetical protein